LLAQICTDDSLETVATGCYSDKSALDGSRECWVRCRRTIANILQPIAQRPSDCLHSEVPCAARLADPRDPAGSQLL